MDVYLGLKTVNYRTQEFSARAGLPNLLHPFQSIKRPADLWHR